jgi:hypothetical protein
MPADLEPLFCSIERQPRFTSVASLTAHNLPHWFWAMSVRIRTTGKKNWRAFFYGARPLLVWHWYVKLGRRREAHQARGRPSTGLTPGLDPPLGLPVLGDSSTPRSSLHGRSLGRGLRLGALPINQADLPGHLGRPFPPAVLSFSLFRDSPRLTRAKKNNKVCFEK